jgi:hypothetical protein
VIAPFAHPKPHIKLAREWIDYMYSEWSVPETWHVWLSRYDGRHPIVYDFHAVLDSRLVGVEQGPHLGEVGVDGSEVSTEGIVGTLVVGYLALKILGVHRHRLTRTRATGMIPIWPTSGVSFQWPPTLTLTDKNIKDYFSLWLPPGTILPSVLQ